MMARVSGVSCKAMALACSRKWSGTKAGFQGKEGALANGSSPTRRRMMVDSEVVLAMVVNGQKVTATARCGPE